MQYVAVADNVVQENLWQRKLDVACGEHTCSAAASAAPVNAGVMGLMGLLLGSVGAGSLWVRAL